MSSCARTVSEYGDVVSNFLIYSLHSTPPLIFCVRVRASSYRVSICTLVDVSNES